MTLPAALASVPADSIRRAVQEVFARPEFRWLPRPRPWAWLVDLWHALERWLGGLDLAHPVLYQTIMWAAVVGLVALLVHIGYTAVRVWRATVAPAAAPGAAPARAADPAAEHRARARALAAQGRYAEALGHLFVVALLELERAHAVAVHPSKTPAEYVREVRLDAAGRETFAALVETLYRHLFGGRPCDAEGVRRFGDAAEGLVRHVVAG